MYSHPFSKNSLKNATRAGDSQRYDVDLETDFDTIIEEAAQKIVDDSLDFGHKRISVQGGRQLFLLDDYITVLSLRAAAAAVAKLNRIRPTSRDSIVQGTLEALFDATPSHVIRCDFSSFYENIDVGQVIEDIYADTRTHPYLRRILDGLEKNNILESATPGIPRGLGLSATLSELRLKEFDESIRKLPNVYRYFRFADDFVVFTIGDPDSTIKHIQGLCGEDLKLNKQKTRVHPIPTLKDTDKSPCAELPTKIDFLGYKFLVSQGIRGQNSRAVRVTISDSKIKKRKTRTILALKDFVKSGDGELLLMRLRLLSSNMSIRRSGQTSGSRKSRVQTGIFYNYRACGNYGCLRGRPILHSDQAVPELNQLDGFLHSLLWRPNSEFFHDIQTKLTAGQKDRLRKLSFKQGFHKKMTIRLSRREASMARKVWRHA
ncbi:MAG: RNA-directed DNA polymerase [Maritimibacter sp.]|uniref:antiviral reverse transcriptase Drt3a n=1 Tax=Maritimibacter sp. TaxID=2003363 RepID=UPI001D525976|nr:antiviral reverse transcriptase Drt3a [Maritimibacter sp.]MBL6426699.1 RNA-directed DNA polymerase [Maritimibacter sp.]